jgi:outer membrane protein OmpA-like peptidoglycan-associated protein
VQPAAPANDPAPADAAPRPDRPGVVLARPQIEALSEAVRNRPPEGLPKLDATRIVPADCARQIPPNTIYFEHDAAALNAAAQESLNTFAKKLLASGCRLREVRIDGHDERAASDAYSVRLSERRAKAAADVLVAAGIPVAVLQVNALGASQLAVQTDPGVREARNRRVEVWVTTASR